jgi:hypothetical protein
LDPGFFLQKVIPRVNGLSTKLQAAALGNVDRDQLLRDAALQAQEEYDMYIKSRGMMEDGNGGAESEVEHIEPGKSHEIDDDDNDDEEMDVEPEKEIAVPLAPVSIADADDDESSMQPEATLDPVEMEEELMVKEEPEVMTAISSVASTPALPVTTAAPIVVTAPQQPLDTTAEVKTAPLSMEDALLLDMDDDDSSDED